MKDQRAKEFARCAVALALALRETSGIGDTLEADVARGGNPFAPPPVARAEDPFAPSLAGSEGIFDQALTNGLAAIVAHEWPGEEKDKKGRVLYARQLLCVIEKHVTPGADGDLVIPDPRGDRPPPQSPADSNFHWRQLPALDTRIDARVLVDGLDVSQSARHARGTGGLERQHIDALLALDDHKSLRTMSEQHADRAWENAREEDRHSATRAAAFLELIGDDEAARRAEGVDNPNEYHPKHNPNGHDLDTCPICGYRTFCVQGLDIRGRVGFGQCLICTYIRSPDTADDEGYGEHLAWLDGKD
ncbi:hypothetical protein FBY35_0111 [Streptomyces sp. SLBN-118]|uniref:hypothetical protein n=1 Tax=Streptomyces sp. SLBN-118 TaxID=2768454 RepID=UPI00116A7C15|nr:hypothetical protein [Streptomyces sp. SLBN-118]TQK49837.1 hypothetical protein FBY35_0111 [Streptomyces sp. SLBN-118]